MKYEMIYAGSSILPWEIYELETNQLVVAFLSKTDCEEWLDENN